MHFIKMKMNVKFYFVKNGIMIVKKVFSDFLLQANVMLIDFENQIKTFLYFLIFISRTLVHNATKNN